MIIAFKYEVPDICPRECPDYGCPWGQASLCFRCPILNCSGDEPILRPDDYREDWAEAWERWFKNGMKGLPQLYF
jgi:hypothetical protein